MMIAIDTSSPVGSLAVCDDTEVIAEITMPGAQTHLEQLIPKMKAMLDEIDLKINQLTGVAVGLGPGSFTGTRIGIVAARALSQALKLPIQGVSSLDLIAHQIITEMQTVVAAVDARRGEVYRAFYENSDSRPKRITDYETRSPAALIKECEAFGKVVLAGNAILAYPDLGLSETIKVDDNVIHPKASTLCRLLSKRLHSQNPPYDLSDIVPIYVRPSDAELGVRHD